MNTPPINQPPALADRAAFTLIELLTVIAIIGVLAGIIIPVLGKVRTNATNAKDTNQVRTITTAALLYAGDNKGILPNANRPLAGTALTSGGIDRWTFGEAINRYLPTSSTNTAAIYNWKNNPVWYSDVTEAYSGWAFNASYPGALKPAAFGYNQYLDNPTNWSGYISRVPNPSKYVLIGEVLDDAIKVDPSRAAVTTNNTQTRYRVSRNGKALYGFVDGHVEMLTGDLSEPGLVAASKSNLWRWW
jgi:prepilin-type N-terminal cleavage/methylation domain-containing protein/prepilin-type processing-associated H-X9-DG protein